MPVSQGDLISAEQFNGLVNKYEKYWGDLYPTSSFSDADNTNHRYGWGQRTVEPTVNTSALIEAEQVNRLVSQINAGVFHTTNNLTEMLPHYDISARILSSEYQRIDTRITGLEPIKFNSSEYYTDQTIELDDVEANFLWSDAIAMKAKAKFVDYTAARYFFNSGGKISFDLSAFGGMVGLNEWQSLFNIVGEIKVGAVATFNDNVNSGFSAGGFYSCNDAEYTQIFMGAGTGGTGGAYGAYGSYGGYGGYGGYSNKLIIIYGKVIENSDDTLDFILKVKLVDNVLNDDQRFDTTISLDVGLLFPTMAPEDPSNTRVSTGTYSYQFGGYFTPDISEPPSIAKPIPEVTLHQVWQQASAS